MKFGTQANKDMLSPKHSSPTVRRNFPRWPPPPCRKTLEWCVWAVFDAISKKIWYTDYEQHAYSKKFNTAGPTPFFKMALDNLLEWNARFLFQSSSCVICRNGTKTVTWLFQKGSEEQAIEKATPVNWAFNSSAAFSVVGVNGRQTIVLEAPLAKLNSHNDMGKSSFPLP